MDSSDGGLGSLTSDPKNDYVLVGQFVRFSRPAALLSFFLLGGGQALQGYWRRGAALVVGYNGTGWLVTQVAPLVPPHPFWVPLYLIFLVGIHLWAAWDAGRLAPRENTAMQKFKLVLIPFGIALLSYGLIKTALDSEHSWGRSYHIPSESGIPTLRVGDYVIADCRRPESVLRGDVVVFHPPSPRYTGENTQLVKRVVAVSGDTVEITDGRLILNGKTLQEPYLREPMQGEYPAHQVEPDSMFLLGDNRNNSADSRVFGDVPLKNYVGRVSWIYWSATPGRAGTAEYLRYKD